MFHATHFLNLIDKMCKYEMDPTSIVEDTCGQAETSIPHPNFVAAGGVSYHDIQIVLPLSSIHVLMAKNDAHYFI